MRSFVDTNLLVYADASDERRTQRTAIGCISRLRTPQGIRAALDLVVLHKLSFCDALIVEAAARAGCTELLSEDLQGGAVVAGVRIVNPFS